MPFGGSSPPLSVYVEIFVFLFFKINFTCVFASLQRSVFSSTNKNVVYCFNESFQFHWMLYLQVDGIRTELNYKTPTWFLESCLMQAWGGWGPYVWWQEVSEVKSSVWGADRLTGKKESQGKIWGGFHFTPKHLGQHRERARGKSAERGESVTIP